MNLTAALLVQAAVLASHPAPRAPQALNVAPIRVWRADSIAYVTLREPGHLVLLNVDPIGRITVLFPFEPSDGTEVNAGVPFAVPLPPEAQGNPATLVAVRSRWMFDFAALRGGAYGTWNYQDAWLLQPTAGDPLAAALDIADRVTAGRPYDYGQVTYSNTGAVVARGAPVQPDVCLTCYRRVAPAPAATVATNNVDCTNASLTNSFCGVNSGSLSIASAPAPAPQVVYISAPAPASVYVPYFVPITRGFRHLVEPPSMPQPATPASHGMAFPIAPQLIVPSSSQLRTFTGRRH